MKRYRLDETAIEDLAARVVKALELPMAELDKVMAAVISYLDEE